MTVKESWTYTVDDNPQIIIHQVHIQQNDETYKQKGKLVKMTKHIVYISC